MLPVCDLDLAIVVALFLGLGLATQVHAQNGVSSSIDVSIISPANGEGAEGQTLEAGVFAITNTGDVTQIVRSISVTFSRAPLFSSATVMTTPVSTSITPSPSTVSPPAASTIFTFDQPVFINPGNKSVFSL